jgi:hypothetical protein
MFLTIHTAFSLLIKRFYPQVPLVVLPGCQWLGCCRRAQLDRRLDNI